jgi:hypothetical protein
MQFSIEKGNGTPCHLEIILWKIPQPTVTCIEKREEEFRRPPGTLGMIPSGSRGARKPGSMISEIRGHRDADCLAHNWRHGVSDKPERVSSGFWKSKPVRKGLHTGGLTRCE